MLERCALRHYYQACSSAKNGKREWIFLRWFIKRTGLLYVTRFYDGHREQGLRPIFRFCLKNSNPFTLYLYWRTGPLSLNKNGAFPGLARQILSGKDEDFRSGLWKNHQKFNRRQQEKFVFLRRLICTQVIRLVCCEDIAMWPGFCNRNSDMTDNTTTSSLSYQKVRIRSEKKESPFANYFDTSALLRNPNFSGSWICSWHEDFHPKTAGFCMALPGTIKISPCTPVYY